MSEQPADIKPPAVAGEFSVAVVQSEVAFVFTAGHRMRAAHCLVCDELIGGEPAVLTGAAGLAGGACPHRMGGREGFLAPAPPPPLAHAVRGAGGRDPPRPPAPRRPPVTVI